MERRRLRHHRLLENVHGNAGTASNYQYGLNALQPGHEQHRQHRRRCLKGVHSSHGRLPSQILFPVECLAGGGDADGADYTAAAAQKTFLAIAQAADDVRRTFPDAHDAPALQAVLVAWAVQETRRWGSGSL